MAWYVKKKDDEEKYQYRYTPREPVEVRSGWRGKVEERAEIAKARLETAAKAGLEKAKGLPKAAKGYAKEKVKQYFEQEHIKSEAIKKAKLEGIKAAAKSHMKEKYGPQKKEKAPAERWRASLPPRRSKRYSVGQGQMQGFDLFGSRQPQEQQKPYSVVGDMFTRQPQKKQPRQSGFGLDILGRPSNKVDVIGFDIFGKKKRK